jgi:hypothetical protein
MLSSSSPGRASKRAKPTAPYNHRLHTPIVYSAARTADAIRALQTGREEAIVVDAGISPPCPGAEMVRYWNARVKPERRVPAPATWADITMKTYGGLPGITGGMWHAYATSAHDYALDSPVIDGIFTAITGTSAWQVRPNRMRFNATDSDEGYRTVHIEGPHVLSEASGISAILCMSAGRTFTYYKGSNNDPRARQLFVELGGQKSLFVQPKPEQLEHWQRTTIETTRPGQVILFADSVIHEVSRLGSNTLSLYLSPFDPARVVSEIEFYKGCGTRKQAMEKRKQAAATATATATGSVSSQNASSSSLSSSSSSSPPPPIPPLPARLRTSGAVRQHPKEYSKMSRRETEIFGSLFHITGYCWPSDKLTFFMMHMMAFNAFQHKLLPFCFDADGKYNYEVITPELVAGCEAFDTAYFDGLPLARVTSLEVATMRAKFTGIPAAAWEIVKCWTKDPRMCSDNVCKRRGYY